jgi:hypothetical protein
MQTTAPGPQILIQLTFLMTGDMIIRTTASPKTRRDASSRNASDSSDSCVAVDMETPPQFINDSIEDSPKLNRTFQRSADFISDDTDDIVLLAADD